MMETPIEVHHISIQFVDCKKIPDKLKTQNHSESVLRIIEHHNERLSQTNKYTAEGRDDIVRGYHSKKFGSTTKITTNISKVGISKQEEARQTVYNDFILFIWKDEKDKFIICLTSGNAWTVVRPYVDYSFPYKVVQIVGDPKNIIQFERRCIFSKSFQTQTYPQACEIYGTSQLYYLVESLKCELKSDSSLFQKINSMKTINRCWIQARAGGILKIGQSMCIENEFPEILDLLRCYMNGEVINNMSEEKADGSFEFLNFLQLADNKTELDTKLIEDIFDKHEAGTEQQVQVLHSHQADFLSSNKFEIVVSSSSKGIGDKPPKIEDVIEAIGENDKNKFTDAMKTGKISFTKASGTTYSKNIVDCIEGDIYFSEKQYFKIRGTWYTLNTNYWELLYEDFKRLVKDSLIAKGTEAWLEKEWEGKSENKHKNLTEKAEEALAEKELERKSENKHVNLTEKAEERYCRSYLEYTAETAEGWLVLDQITPDNIEPCDIVKYTKDTVYLYHVKEKFGQHTRVACSQIFNAASLICSAIQTNGGPNYLEKLWESATTLPIEQKSADYLTFKQKLKDAMDKLGKEAFMDIFFKRKIVFVYAFVVRNESFSELLQLHETPIRKDIVDVLIRLNYLDEYRRLKGKFFTTTKKQFVNEVVKTNSTNKNFESKEFKDIYDQLHAGTFSESTLAKIELVELKHKLKNLNFELKICEIQRLDIQV